MLKPTMPNHAYVTPAAAARAQVLLVLKPTNCAPLDLMLKPTTLNHAYITPTAAARAQVLLVLKPTNCAPLDLLPSLLAAQCSCCSAVMSLRSVQVGKATQK